MRHDVAVAGARHTSEHGGTVYYFCCGGCAAKFLRDHPSASAQGDSAADPERYLAA